MHRMFDEHFTMNKVVQSTVKDSAADEYRRNKDYITLELLHFDLSIELF
jgi:hypothetical protein